MKTLILLPLLLINQAFAQQIINQPSIYTPTLKPPIVYITKKPSCYEILQKKTKNFTKNETKELQKCFNKLLQQTRKNPPNNGSIKTENN